MKLASFKQELKQLIALAIPMAIAEAAAMGMAFCDAIYAAHASIDDLAGVSLGAAFWSPLIVFSFGALIIIATYAARHIGANKTQHLDKTLQSGLRLAICWGLLLSALLFCSHWLVPYFSLSEKAQQVASSYIMWLSPALFLWTLFTALTLFAEGIGQVKLPMIIAIIGLAFNALANYLLVFGFWFIPAQGGVGCAYATSLTAILMLACFVICIKNPNYSRHQLLKKYYRIPFSEIKKLLLKGLPAGIGSMSENLIFVSVALILAATSTQAVAANQMVRTFYEVIFVLIFALSQAVTIRTATAIGSNNSKQIRHCISTGIYSTLAVAMLLALGLYTGASFIIGLYTDDINTASLANSIMLISALLLLPDSFQYVMLAIMRAYHDIKIPYLLFMLCGWLIGFPLGIALAYGTYLNSKPLGPIGLWYGIFIGLTVASITLWLRFILHTQRTDQPDAGQIQKTTAELTI